MMIDMSAIPVFKQTQDSLLDQLSQLKMVANRLGLYDAADAIGQLCENTPDLKG